MSSYELERALMSKKDVLKRVGQIYALALQHGLTDEDIILHLNREFAFLYQGEKYKQYKNWKPQEEL